MNIEVIKRRLLIKYPLFGSVIANSNFIAESEVKTAGTDGKNIYYNPNFIETITDEEQTFIFAHEICHIAFDHVFRSEGKDKDLWNIATDSVINAFLKQDGLPIIKGGIDIPEAINYDAEEMYKKLLEEKKQQQQNSNQGNNSQNNDSEQQKEQQPQDKESFSNSTGKSSDNQNEQSNSKPSSSSDQSKTEKQKGKNHDVGHDSHSMWDKAIEKRHQKEQSESNSGQSDNKDKNKQNLNKIFDMKKEQQAKKQQSNEIQNNDQEKKKNEEIKKLIELSEKETFKQNKIERKKQLEELRKALASMSHGHGSDTNSERRNVTNIGTFKPLIDWRRLLKEAVKYDVDWSYQNAGIEDGVVTAYLEEMPRPETEIVLDTSGSISETLLRNFLRECKNILQMSRVKVGCFDTKFYGFTEIKDVSDIDNLNFFGGGGTNFNVAIHAFTRRVENKIIFTDGNASMPDTPIDVIWIVFGKTKINPVGGKVIYIDDKQLNRLYETANKLKLKI